MRFMSACPAQAELPLSSPHDADGLATKGEGAYKYQVTLACLLPAQNHRGPAIRTSAQTIDPTLSRSKTSLVSGPWASEQCFSRTQIDPGSPRRAPKTLEVKSGGSRAASLVGFLKSREGQLGILSMVMLIFQGTALSLTLRFSRYGMPLLALRPPGCQRCSSAACCTMPPDHLLAEEMMQAMTSTHAGSVD